MKQRQELLNDAIAGGMMGGYIEPDFDNDPMYQGGNGSDDSSSNGCNCGEV